MEKHLEQIRLEYDLFETPFVPSKQKVVENLTEGLEMVGYYKNQMVNPFGVYYADEVLSLRDSALEEYVDLQSRILDGYTFEIIKLVSSVDDENFSRVDKLARFLGNKLRVNMTKVEARKKNAAFREMYERRNLPQDYSTSDLGEDDSLFVEVFFAEKFSEVTKKDLFVKEKK